MIGIWHAIVNMPWARLKLQFKVALTAQYTLDVVMEPYPLPIRIETVSVEGNKLSGTGDSFWKPGERVVAELIFGEESFEGSLNMPPFGVLRCGESEGADRTCRSR